MPAPVAPEPEDDPLGEVVVPEPEDEPLGEVPVPKPGVVLPGATVVPGLVGNPVEGAIAPPAGGTAPGVVTVLPGTPTPVAPPPVVVPAPVAPPAGGTAPGVVTVLPGTPTPVAPPPVVVPPPVAPPVEFWAKRFEAELLNTGETELSEAIAVWVNPGIAMKALTAVSPATPPNKPVSFLIEVFRSVPLNMALP